MRIAINGWFWDQPTTGSGQYTRQMVKGLAALGQDLEIILITTEQRQEARVEKQDNPASCILHPVPGSRSNLGKVWFEQVTFPRACRRLGADMAHVPYWAPPLRPSVSTVVTIHDLIPLLLRKYRGGPLVQLYTALVSRAARNAALVLTDSKASKRDIVTHLKHSADCVRAIHLAPGEAYGPVPTSADANVRTRYNLPPSYILYLSGGFDVRKNVAAAIEAYRRAAPTIGATHPLVIAGRLPEQDTAFTPDPRRLTRERGLDASSVRFTGFVDEADKPALYRSATAFVFPSRYEGFGLPPLEALACGTPVVGSNTSSIPEVVGDGGILLSPDDIQGMANALIQLATDADFRAQLSRCALAQAANFSWHQTAQETLAAYREVVDQV